jgi:hypothetical protein
LEAAGGFAPPDAIVGLLEFALLKEIKKRQHEQRCCS